MPTYFVILFITIITYSTLLAGVLREKSTKTRNSFVLYLIVSLVWSLIILLFSLDVMGASRLWAGLAALSGLLTVVAYYHFISVFVSSKAHWTVKLGYAAVFLVFVPLVALGQIPESVSVATGTINIHYGSYLYLMTATGTIFYILAVALLVRGYRATLDSLSRNRFAYLLAGLFIYLAFSVRMAPPYSGLSL